MNDASPVTKWAARLGLAGVTLLAAWASYLHALIVVQVADGRTMVARALPAVADLLIAAASANILDASRRGERWPRVSVVAIVAGVGMTLAFNVAAGSPHAIPSWLVNVWPPVAFILALESFMGHVRRGRGATPPPGAPATSEPDPAMSLDEAITAAAGRMSKRQIAAAFEVSRARVDKVLPPLREVAGVSVNGSGPDE